MKKSYVHLFVEATRTFQYNTNLSINWFWIALDFIFIYLRYFSTTLHKQTIKSNFIFGCNWFHNNFLWKTLINRLCLKVEIRNETCNCSRFIMAYIYIYIYIRRTVRLEANGLRHQSIYEHYFNSLFVSIFAN